MVASFCESWQQRGNQFIGQVYRMFPMYEMACL